MSCGNLLYSVGVMFKTDLYIEKKAIDSAHVSFGKNGIMRFTLDK